jgi:hypothetical protein
MSNGLLDDCPGDHNLVLAQGLPSRRRMLPVCCPTLHQTAELNGTRRVQPDGNRAELMLDPRFRRVGPNLQKPDGHRQSVVLGKHRGSTAPKTVIDILFLTSIASMLEVYGFSELAVAVWVGVVRARQESMSAGNERSRLSYL